MEEKHNFAGNLWKQITRLWKKDIDVYFISGMCYNCKVFDNIELPDKYNKVYLEWLVPDINESVADYAQRMAQAIKKDRPFILVGYSFGGIVIQEMNKFIKPKKNIIISSIKNEEERPTLFRIAQKTSIVEKIPNRLYSSSRFFTRLFNKFVCDAPVSEIGDYMTFIDPTYVKWTLLNIVAWKPESPCPRLYHIHGTADPIFSYSQLKDVYPIIGGDHLMVIRQSENVSLLLQTILSKKE